MFCFLSVLVLNLLVAVVVLCFINTCMRQAKSATVDSLFFPKMLKRFHLWQNDVLWFQIHQYEKEIRDLKSELNNCTYEVTLLTLLRSCFFASAAYNAPSMRPGLENSTFSKMDIIVNFLPLASWFYYGETERRVTWEPIGNRASNGFYSPSTARRGNLKAQLSFSVPAYRVLCTNQSREKKNFHPAPSAG